ncbi:signal peptidase [Paracoccus tegillarcae]|uniref:Signal peptidase n=2 Tax=Paracoccus tegillarcae TaxID=1529068 RepID=A0A2K9EUL0_9RHOB|nr:signal peptidase [Paracoccus tegillarcae]
MIFATSLSLLAGGTAIADVAQAVQDQILPGLSDFADATLDLADVAVTDCDVAAIQPAYDRAFDAWLQIGHLRLGPAETAVISIAFWPDKRGTTPRALAQMIADRDPIAEAAADYAQASAAARGFFALDALLFDEALSVDEDEPAMAYRCGLIATVAADLAAQADQLDRDWRDGFGQTLTTAGQPENAVYLAPEEAMQALYTQLMAGLEFTADQRLGRPLDSFDQPHPRRAEAWRSARSLPNIRASLEGQRALAAALSDAPIPVTQAAFDAAFAAADRVVDPGFQDITDAQAWFRLDVLRQRVQAVRTAVEAELGAALGVSAGFNSADGD